LFGAPFGGALPSNARTNRVITRVTPTNALPSNAHPWNGGATNKPLGDMVGAFQSIVTVEYIRGVKTQKWKPFNKKLWQRNYWEYIIRNESECNRIGQYIENNPANWNLDKLNNGMGNLVLEAATLYGNEVWMI
jgi:hypothetical protein